MAISTDYVFPGRREDAVSRGRSRPGLARSTAAPSWRARRRCARSPRATRSCARRGCYGHGGANFVDTILKRAREGEPLRVVDDQRGSPTWTVRPRRGPAAADGDATPQGTYHCTNRGRLHVVRPGRLRAGSQWARGLGRTNGQRIARASGSAADVFGAESRSFRAMHGAGAMPEWRDAVATATCSVLSADRPKKENRHVKRTTRAGTARARRRAPRCAESSAIDAAARAHAWRTRWPRRPRRPSPASESGGTIYFCGNGGSAADAQHLAAELAGRYLVDRPPLAAIALTTNTSALTAIGNDYGFDARVLAPARGARHARRRAGGDHHQRQLGERAARGRDRARARHDGDRHDGRARAAVRGSRATTR